ncbi:hypothetical protein CB0940_03931 [Cercospora beticola]|uniref:DUF6697 domain-containing protein n=1 Tax=Cercospora beticola TaxID=122368 RepID=A0A2G5HKH2_CERBT|nr:hypothetical protein CB0940_03931 [Cercospora beticola]PIA92703.1 hypothetical protein CB0940_03931 [Cercospora beticola]WPB01133.1 hypothetical protein RHO25_005754 [Cercospora beticola]
MASQRRAPGLEASRWADPPQELVPPPPALAPAQHMSELQIQPYIPAGMQMQPYYAANLQLVPRHFAAEAHHNTAPIAEMKTRLAEMASVHSEDVLQLNRRANQQEDAIEDIKEVFQNDMQVLEQRLNSFIEQQATPLPSKAKHNSSASDPFVDKQPAKKQTPGHIVCETKDAVVDVVIQHIDQVSAKQERVDSAYGSPTRSQPSSAASWRPMAIRKLPPKSISDEAAIHNEVFTWDFLRDLLGGKEWSPGFYFNSSKDCILPTKGYWLVDLTHEPFMPRNPGEHGAKLTAFFNETLAGDDDAPDEMNYKDTPVFVSSDGGKMYRYVGKYSQNRYSDKVGYDTMMEHIPQSVLKFHAGQLAQVGRPKWITTCLKNHFWPKPVYEGPVPTESEDAAAEISKSGIDCKVTKALDAYANELKEWEKSSLVKVNLLEASTILKAFNTEDILSEPGLRLWWEYLECVGYDDAFYDMLVSLAKADSMHNQHNKSAALKETAASHMFSPNHTPSLPKSPLYGASTKALQKKQWQEDPGVDALSLPETKWSTPKFDSAPVAAPKQKAGNQTKATANPFDGKGDMNAAKDFAKEATPAHGRTNGTFAKKAAAKKAAVHGTYPACPPTPAFGAIPGKAVNAENTSEPIAQTKKTKSTPPHLSRGK